MQTIDTLIRNNRSEQRTRYVKRLEILRQLYNMYHKREITRDSLETQIYDLFHNHFPSQISTTTPHFMKKG